MANRILLADSDDRSREMLVKLLEIYGVESIKQTKDGLEAISEMNTQVPTLAIIDIELQKIDGQLICEILRHVPRFHEVKVVMLGNHVAPVLMEKGMQLGIHAFLERPLDAEKVKTIAQLLQAESPFSSPDLPSSINKVIAALSQCARRNLTLLFGRPARILRIEPLTSEYAQKQWDYVANMELKGQVSIQIATGATKESAQALAQVMPAFAAKSSDLSTTLDAFMAGIIDKALPQIRSAFVVDIAKKDLSTGSVQLSRSAQYQFAIHLRVQFESAILRKQFAIPLYVAVTLA